MDRLSRLLSRRTSSTGRTWRFSRTNSVRHVWKGRRCVQVQGLLDGVSTSVSGMHDFESPGPPPSPHWGTSSTGSYHLHHVAPTLAVEHLDQLPWMKWKNFISFTALISFLCLSATSFIHGSSFISFTALISFLHSNAISFFHGIYFICIDFHFILLWPLFHSLTEFISFFHGT